MPSTLIDLFQARKQIGNRSGRMPSGTAWLLPAVFAAIAGQTNIALAEDTLPPAVCQPMTPAAAASKSRPPHETVPHRPMPVTWQKELEAFVAKGNIPGAVVIIKSPDWGVRVGAVGEANLSTHEPMQPTLQFRVGSVTKTFIAQVILHLDQEGKLHLSDPVLKHLGDNPVVAGIPNIDKVTIASLLRMTSGIANYLDAPSIGTSPQADPLKHFTPNDLAGVLSTNGQASGKPTVAPYFTPDQTYPNPYWETILQRLPANPVPMPYPLWNYSNSNYLLLGMIAEKVTGLPAAELLQRYVFGPAGLKDTFFATDASQMPEMHGYTKWGAMPFPTPVFDKWCDVSEIDPSFAWTAGAIISTPFDLLKFEDTIFTTDKLLNAGTKAKWYTFVSADIHPGWEPMQYGTGGLMQIERPYGNARGHGGAFSGYKTLIYYFYDQKISFVLATNTWDEIWEVKMLDAIMPHASSTVTTPQPEQEAKAVTRSDGKVHLSWQAGRVESGTYKLYWGTDLDAVDRADAEHHDGVQLQEISSTEADINAGSHTSYYWRVDTLAPEAKLPLVVGPTWHFDTAQD